MSRWLQGCHGEQGAGVCCVTPLVIYIYQYHITASFRGQPHDPWATAKPPVMSGMTRWDTAKLTTSWPHDRPNLGASTISCTACHNRARCIRIFSSVLLRGWWSWTSTLVSNSASTMDLRLSDIDSASDCGFIANVITWAMQQVGTGWLDFMFFFLREDFLVLIRVQTNLFPRPIVDLVNPLARLNTLLWSSSGWVGGFLVSISKLWKWQCSTATQCLLGVQQITKILNIPLQPAIVIWGRLQLFELACNLATIYSLIKPAINYF